MRNRIDDTESCEICNHCRGIHLKMNGKYCRGMLHYCELCKRFVDKDDKCRKWQKSELLCKFEQDDVNAILAQFKERYNL